MQSFAQAHMSRRQLLAGSPEQGLYDFGMVGGTGSSPGTQRPGFTNVDQVYSIDFDHAPGF
jgi:hypothetical protein